MLVAVDRDRADGEDVGRAGAAGAQAAQDRADAQHELLRAERLREIVVGAEREAANAVVLFAARREHEHRHVARRRLRAKLLEHVVARRAGQHEIEDDERGRSCRAAVERVGSGGRRRDAIAGFDEVVRDERDDVRFVVDDEHALAGDGATARSRVGRPSRARVRRWILATIISIAMALCPPRGTITSA